MNWKSRIRKLTRWRTKNRWRTVKNDGKPSRICSRKRLESIMEAPPLEFFSRKQFFSPKTAEMHSQGVRDIWNNLPSPIYRKRGEEVAAQLAQASWVVFSISNPASKMFWKAQIQKFENFYLHPHLDKFTPLLS